SPIGREVTSGEAGVRPVVVAMGTAVANWSSLDRGHWEWGPANKVGANEYPGSSELEDPPAFTRAPEDTAFSTSERTVESWDSLCIAPIVVPSSIPWPTTMFWV